MITKITRKLKGITLECVQLHDLNPTFNCKIGSVTRMVDSSESELIYLADWMLFEKYFIQKSEKYFTREQKDASDVDGNGYLTKEDLDELYNLYQFHIFSLCIRLYFSYVKFTSTHRISNTIKVFLLI